MTRYLMSVFGPAEYKQYGNYPSEEAMKQALADTGVFNQRLQEEGYWVFADGLAPATSATVVDGQGAEPVVTDGPTWNQRKTSAASGSSRLPTSTWR